MTKGNERFTVKEKGGEWLIFDKLSAARNYIGVTTLVKSANLLQEMAIRWEKKLALVSNKNKELEEQIETLQQAHVVTVEHLAQENARLQAEVEQCEAVSVPPADCFEELEVRDDEILTLKAKLMISKAYVSEFTQVRTAGVPRKPITYEVYINPSRSLEVTSRNGWRAIGHSVKFATAVGVMKWYIETYMNGEIPQWMISNG